MEQGTKFTLGKFNCAIDPDTVVQLEDGRWAVTALFFRRKAEVYSVSKGLQIIYSKEPLDIKNFTDFVAAYTKAQQIHKDYNSSFVRSHDPLGAYAHSYESYTWDGTKMRSYDEDFVEEMEAWKFLAPILETFPLLPSNYLNWFSTKDI